MRWCIGAFKMKSYCKLPHCCRCHEKLHKENAFYRSNGVPLRPCKTCQAEMLMVRNWVKRGTHDIDSRIEKLSRELELLAEAKQLAAIRK